jgi:pseudouridine kinase
MDIATWIWVHMKKLNKILVVGCINIDLTFTSEKKLVIGDSNPAVSHIGIGGVGANIARNLSVLGNHVFMLTVLGDNAFYEVAKHTLIKKNVDLSLSWTKQQLPSNLYVNILDAQNDLFLGLNDMRASLEITPKKIIEQTQKIKQFDYIVLDNNIPVDTMKEIIKINPNATLAMDTVSAAKSVKVLEIMPDINILKMNLIEFNKLRKKGFNPEQYKDKTFIITDHENPIQLFYKGKKQVVAVPTVKGIVNASGAGDALLSGYISSIIEHKNQEDALKDGIELAHRVLLSIESAL